MPMQRTLGIIKPNAVERRLVGTVVKAAEDGGLRVVALRMVRLTMERARAFYAVHEGKPFYDGLVEFMSSGPIVAMALEGDDAVVRWRQIMGATDPSKAAPGTIRKAFGEDTRRNAVHGSDAVETAAQEIEFFFPDSE